MLWRTAAKLRQLRIEHRRPWRQSNHGTFGGLCFHRMGHHCGPRVHWLNAIDVEKTLRHQSYPSKRTCACFWSKLRLIRRSFIHADVDSGVRQELAICSSRRTARFLRWNSWSNQGTDGRRREETVATGTMESSSDESWLSCCHASSSEQLIQHSGRQSCNCWRASDSVMTSSWCHGRRTTNMRGVSGRNTGTDHWSRWWSDSPGSYSVTRGDGRSRRLGTTSRRPPATWVDSVTQFRNL